MRGERLWVRRAFAAVVTILALCGVACAGDGRLTRKQVTEDIEQLYGNLVTFHPNLYRHISPKAFKRLKAQLIADLPKEVYPINAYATLQRLAAAVCDTHTSVEPTPARNYRKSKEWPWHQWRLIVANNKLYAESGKGNFQEWREIKAISNIPGPEIARYLAGRRSYDGCAGKRPLRVNHDNSLQIAFNSLFSPTPFVFEVTFLSKGGSEGKPVFIAPTKYYEQRDYSTRTEGKRQYYMEGILRRHGFKLEEGTTKNTDSLKHYYSEENNISYVAIRSFERFISTEMIDRKMREALGRKPEAIVLDLSQNPGGQNKLAKRVLAYLVPKEAALWDDAHMTDLALKRKLENFTFARKDYKKTYRDDISLFKRSKKAGRVRKTVIYKNAEGVPDFKGPIYVVVGPYTSSAAGNLAYRLRKMRNAKIVGTPISVDINSSCFAAIGYFTLKHTRSHAYIPFLCHSNRNRNIEQRGDLELEIEIDLQEAKYERYRAIAVDKAVRLAKKD